MASITLRENEPLEKALKRFKKSVDKENIVQEWKRREFFEKPSTIKNRKNREIKRKFLKNRGKVSSIKNYDK